MNEQNHGHLQEDLVLWAVVDRMELSPEARQHLQSCHACSEKVTKLEEDLAEFGRKAGQAVPPFARPVKMSTAEPAKSFQVGGWFSFLGAAAMAGLVIFFYLMNMNYTAPVEVSSLQNQEQFLEDEALMREVSEIVEYPLPEDIYLITGENGVSYDEEFFDFIVPGTEDDTESELFI